MLAVARFEAGEAAAALDLLAAGIEQFPYDRTLRYALASYQASGGFVDEARAGLEQLLQIWPDDAQAIALYRQLADQP